MNYNNFIKIIFALVHARRISLRIRTPTQMLDSNSKLIIVNGADVIFACEPYMFTNDSVGTFPDSCILHFIENDLFARIMKIGLIVTTPP